MVAMNNSYLANVIWPKPVNFFPMHAGLTTSLSLMTSPDIFKVIFYLLWIWYTMTY